MDGQDSGGAELLWVDFCSCAYEVSNLKTEGALYVFNKYPKRQYHIESPLPEPLHEKLMSVFQQCIVYYMPFVRDPKGFLHDIKHTLLWDERSGEYVLVIKHSKGRPGERMFVWLRLKSNGYVFVSLLSIPETAEEAEKWQIIRDPAVDAVLEAAGGMAFKQNQNSPKVFEEFSFFLAKHKGVYDYLYVNAMGIYQDIVASPAQMRGEEAGQKEAAMGFLPAPEKGILIMAQEPMGAGWVLMSLVTQASAARLREKLSGLKKNGGGIRWKPIDIPYGAMVFLDKGVVFYKVVELHKPEDNKIGYMFEFKANQSKTYIRFPYIFRSYKKLVNFVERAGLSRPRMWMRIDNK
jgi:hypothetical protein